MGDFSGRYFHSNQNKIIEEHSQFVPFTNFRQKYALFLFYLYELTAFQRAEQFLSRFHKGGSQF